MLTCDVAHTDIDVTKQVPHDFAGKVVIVSLAAGVAFVQDDTNIHGVPELLTVAVGRAKLDTIKLEGVAPSGRGKDWMSHIEQFCYKIRGRQHDEVSASFSEGSSDQDSQLVSTTQIQEWIMLGNEPNTFTGNLIIICEEGNLVALEQEHGLRFGDMCVPHLPHLP